MPITVFGPIEIFDRHGERIAPLSDRQRRLVAALAVDAGTPVSGERLVHRVWDDDELPASGVRALHTRISRLRPHLRVAGVEIATHGHSYALEADGSLDVTRFEELVAAGRTTIAEGDLVTGVAQLEEAISLRRGDAYADVAGLDWAQPEIARLDELHAAALEHRFEALLHQGRHTQIVPAVEEAIGGSPWRDRLRIQLALALYRSGRQAEALRSIARYRRELADELGLEPGSEIRELESKMLAQAPELAIVESPVRTASAYRFHEVVGEGAFALVWRASQPALGRQVAIKQIRPQLANRPEFIRRFESEAQLVASLEHPYVVPLHDYWREPDGAFLVMRWLRGGTLSSRLSDGPLDASSMARLVTQVGTALKSAHAAGVIHRDVKSSNILHDNEGNAFLSDFGIAFGAGDDDAFAQAISSGSPAYASPEQLRLEGLDERSDLYSLGVVVFEAATGRLPFMAASEADLVRSQLEEPVPRPSDIVTGSPDWVDAVVAGCCAKDRADRFADVDELLAAIPHSAEAGTAGAGTTAAVIRLDDEHGGARGRDVDDRNPYKGLRAFEEADAADFCGRQRLVDRFLQVLSRPGTAGRLLVAVGASGSGKSSAVRAGLIPALRRGECAGSERWLMTTMIPGDHPFEELEAALLRIAASPPGPLVELMMADDRGVARATRLAAPASDAEILLVIDQFEELFTLTHADDRRRFLDGVTTALADPRARLRVVATIRADFWDRPLQHPTLATVLEDAAISVPPLSADELEQAIAEPARRHGVELEPALVARLIADVADQPGALPLLQFTLTALFDEQRDGIVAAEAYQSFGGIDGALAMRAERVHQEAEAIDRVGMRRVLGELVTLGEGVPDTRRRTLLGDVAVDAPTRAAVDMLGDARLLTFDHDQTTREPTVEIAHEALLSTWPTLRTWLDEDRGELRTRRQLAAAAQDWDANHRDHDRLYRGARLDDAIELAAHSTRPLGPGEAAFLAASRDRADADAARSRHRTRVLQGLLGLAAVLLFAAIVAGVVAVGQRNDARAARIGSEVDRMAAAAPARADADPRLALLMAAEAHARSDDAESLGALQRTLLSAGPILGYVGDPELLYRDVRWIDDTTIVAVHLGGVEAYDLETGARTFSHAVDVPEVRGIRAVNAGGVVPFDASPNGGSVAVGTSADAVEVIELATGASRTIPHEARVMSVAYDPDGSVLATGDVEGVVRVFEANTGELEMEVVAHPEHASEFQALVAPLGMIDGYGEPSSDAVDRGVHELEYLPDGSLLTAVTPVVRRWDTSSGRQIGNDVFPPADVSQFPPPYNPPLVITTLIDEVHPDPRDPMHLAVASRNYLLEVTLDEGARTSQIWTPTDRSDSNTTIAGSAFTDDGTWIVWLSDGRIRALDEDGTPDLTVRPALQNPAALEPDPSGTRLAGAGDGGIVVLSLTGETLLAEGISRAVPGSFTTISDDGTLVAESDRVNGPTVFHRRTGTGWSQVALPSEIAEFSAEVPIDIDGEPLVPVFRPLTAEPDGPTEDAVNAVMETSWRDADTGAPRFALEGAFFARAISPDERLFALHSGLTIDVWDMRTQSKVAALPELAAQPPPREPVLGGEFVRSLAFSHDGGRLVATVQDGRIAMWETDTWDPVDLPAGIGAVVVADFSPDGRYFAAAGSGGAITLYDAATFEVVEVMRGLAAVDSTLGLFEWSADGRHLLTLIDGVPRLWDLESGQQVGDEFPLVFASQPGSASGEELQLVTIRDDFLNVWNLDTDSWAPIACRAAGRNMTQAEWEGFGPADEPYRSTCPQFPPGA